MVPKVYSVHSLALGINVCQLLPRRRPDCPVKRLAAVAHFPLTAVLGGGAVPIMPISSEATEDQNSYLTAPRSRSRR